MGLPFLSLLPSLPVVESSQPLLVHEPGPEFPVPASTKILPVIVSVSREALLVCEDHVDGAPQVLLQALPDLQVVLVQFPLRAPGPYVAP